MAEHFEARHADRIDHRATIREELHVSHLQHAAVIGKPDKSSATRRYFTHHLLSPAWSYTGCEKGSEAQSSRSHLPFQLVRNAHAELLGSRLHGSANHQPVAWLKYVQRAGDCGKCHGADEDGNFLVQTGVEKFDSVKDYSVTRQLKSHRVLQAGMFFMAHMQLLLETSSV